MASSPTVVGTDRFHAAIEGLVRSGLDEYALVRALARHLREAVPYTHTTCLTNDRSRTGLSRRLSVLAEGGAALDERLTFALAGIGVLPVPGP